MLLGYHFSGECPYVYGYGGIETPKLNYVQIAENKIRDNFSENNFVALVYPKTDYSVEKELLAELDGLDEVDYSMGLSNVEAMDGYMLADKLTPRQFAELAGLDYDVPAPWYSSADIPGNSALRWRQNTLAFCWLVDASAMLMEWPPIRLRLLRTSPNMRPASTEHSPARRRSMWFC